MKYFGVSLNKMCVTKLPIFEERKCRWYLKLEMISHIHGSVGLTKKKWVSYQTQSTDSVQSQSKYQHHSLEIFKEQFSTSEGKTKTKQNEQITTTQLS